jgi:hypothetical protein
MPHVYQEMFTNERILPVSLLSYIGLYIDIRTEIIIQSTILHFVVKPIEEITGIYITYTASSNTTTKKVIRSTSKASAETALR